MSSAAPLSCASSSTIAAGVEIGRQHPHIVQRLGQDAAEADHENAAPIGIVARTKNELHARARHCLDEHAVERKSGRALAMSAWSFVPACDERRVIGEAENDAADVALVRERRPLCAFSTTG